jgi:hypothetical protein
MFTLTVTVNHFSPISSNRCIYLLINLLYSLSFFLYSSKLLPFPVLFFLYMHIIAAFYLIASSKGLLLLPVFVSCRTCSNPVSGIHTQKVTFVYSSRAPSAWFSTQKFANNHSEKLAYPFSCSTPLKLKRSEIVFCCI